MYTVYMVLKNVRSRVILVWKLDALTLRVLLLLLASLKLLFFVFFFSSSFKGYVNVY